MDSTREEPNTGGNVSIADQRRADLELLYYGHGTQQERVYAWVRLSTALDELEEA